MLVPGFSHQSFAHSKLQRMGHHRRSLSYYSLLIGQLASSVEQKFHPLLPALFLLLPTIFLLHGRMVARRRKAFSDETAVSSSSPFSWCASSPASSRFR
ncbi:hypothetical protein DAI22_06g187800 [Oryza sativa Japonica Group]|nr:hypothetical protein DAI22_06g187800 [Oryza sativa Japonica Group]